MTRLARFQDGFAALLLPDAPAPAQSQRVAPDVAEALARLAAQPGFAVYQNTVHKACVDAIEANFPAVTRLVGHEWMRAAAAVFVRDSLPAHPSLIDYGARFPEFMAAFAPAAELPYLPAVGRLDRLWIEAHVAADASVLSLDALAGLDPLQLQRCALVPHPATRWAWFAESPAWTIWSRNRPDTQPDSPSKPGPGPATAPPANRAVEQRPDPGFEDPICWRAEGALLTRPEGAVCHRPVGRAAIAFLDACAASRTVAQAMLDALDVDAEADLASLIFELVATGAFSALNLPTTEDNRP